MSSLTSQDPSRKVAELQKENDELKLQICRLMSDRITGSQTATHEEPVGSAYAKINLLHC